LKLRKDKPFAVIHPTMTCINSLSGAHASAAAVHFIAAAGASFEVTNPDKGNAAQIAACWGHLEAVVKLVKPVPLLFTTTHQTTQHQSNKCKLCD
jgi:hypothetical protein